VIAGSRYVAMGSSFAAGPGLGQRAPGSPPRAGRSTANYAGLLASELGLRLTDVSYSGAVTADILSRRADGWPAQLDAVTEDTKLVTMTCGGNDVGYVKRLLLSSLPWPLGSLPGIRRRAHFLASTELIEERFAEVSSNMLQIAAGVSHRAPGCQLAFVDYLTILPPHRGTPTGALPPEIAEWGRGVAHRLTDVARKAAGRSGCIFVPAGDLSVDHHAWSAVPWTRHFSLTRRGGPPYHPNAAGMAAVADMIAAAL
jgi:lysophospholipase L1-like esterase